MSRISKIEVHEFEFEAKNLGRFAGVKSIGGLSYVSQVSSISFGRS